MTAATTARRGTERFGDRPETDWRPLAGSGFREAGMGLLVGLGISLLVVGPGLWKVYGEYSAREAATRAFEQRLVAHDRLLAAPPGEVLALGTVVHGKGLFDTTCAACHGADGKGLPNLGKDLTASWFAASLDDAALRRFVSEGRPVNDPLNSTKIPMPPKGGHPELTDADLADIIVYVRGLQDPRRMPDLPASALAAPAPAAPTEDEKARALAAAGGDEELAGYIVHGSTLFGATCSACHGKDAKGLPNLGKNLRESEFVRKLDDDALLAFVKRGRDPGDPLNTTKVGMPPKGGNPALSDDDLLDIIAYVRSIQSPVGTASNSPTP